MVMGGRGDEHAPRNETEKTRAPAGRGKTDKTEEKMMVAIALKSKRTEDIADAYKRARSAYKRGFLSFDEYMETLAYLREVIHERI